MSKTRSWRVLGPLALAVLFRCTFLDANAASRGQSGSASGCDPTEFARILTDDHGWGDPNRLAQMLKVGVPGTSTSDWIQKGLDLMIIDNALSGKGKAKLWADIAAAIRTKNPGFKYHQRELENGDILIEWALGEVLYISKDGTLYRGKLSQLRQIPGQAAFAPDLASMDRAMIEMLLVQFNRELVRSGADTLGKKWNFIIRKLIDGFYREPEGAIKEFERWLAVIRQSGEELPMRSFTDSSGARIFYSQDNRVLIFHPNGQIEEALIPPHSAARMNPEDGSVDQNLLSEYGDDWREHVDGFSPLQKYAGEERAALLKEYDQILQRVDANGYANPGRNAVAYIVKEMAGQPMHEKVLAWKRFASLIQQQESGFRSYEYAGTDGSVVFRGSAGHALVITKDGAVYRGDIPEEMLSRNDIVWKPDYSRLRRLYPQESRAGIPRDPKIEASGNEVAKAGLVIENPTTWRIYQGQTGEVDGVHVYLLVRRDSDGKEVMVMANRLAEEPGKINTHRSLEAQARAIIGEDAYTVLAAGEVNIAGNRLLGISNRSGTYPSPDRERMEWAEGYFRDHMGVLPDQNIRRSFVEPGAPGTGRLVHDEAEKLAATLARLTPAQRDVYKRTLQISSRLGAMLHRYGIGEDQYRAFVDKYLQSVTPNIVEEGQAYRHYSDLARAQGEEPMRLAPSEYWLVNPTDDRHLLSLIQRIVRGETQAGALRYTDVWARLFGGDPEQQMLVLRRLPRLVSEMLRAEGRSISPREIRREILPVAGVERLTGPE